MADPLLVFTHVRVRPGRPLLTARALQKAEDACLAVLSLRLREYAVESLTYTPLRLRGKRYYCVAVVGVACARPWPPAFSRN